MIDNPYDWAGGDHFRAVAWGRGYLFGLTGPTDDLEAVPESTAVELRSAFCEGMWLGHCAAACGLDIFRGPIDVLDREQFPADAELAVTSTGFIDLYVEAAVRVASSAFSTVLMAFTNVLLANHRSTSATEVAHQLDRHFVGTISSMGRRPCTFYVGGAVDFGEVGGELRLTPLFRAQSAARCAALEFGRPSHFVACWSADRSDTLTVLDAYWPALRGATCC